jgi:GNAT superfamily N-acetyltransferase
MKIGHSESLSWTPAFALIVEGWNELVQAGETPEGSAHTPFASSQAFYAEEDDGEIVGVLVFDRQGRRQFDVTLAYVEPTSRRQGVFAELFAALKAKAKQDRVARIVCASADQAMQAVMARLGGQVAGVVYEVPVP